MRWLRDRCRRKRRAAALDKAQSVELVTWFEQMRNKHHL